MLVDVTAATLTVDGIRGPATEAATLHYQTEYRTDLDRDGSPGPRVRAALEADMATLQDINAKIDKMPADIWNRMMARAGSREPTVYAETLLRYTATRAQVAELNAKVAGLSAAVEALADQQGIDPETVTSAIREAVEKSTADMRIVLTTSQEG